MFFLDIEALTIVIMKLVWNEWPYSGEVFVQYAFLLVTQCWIRLLISDGDLSGQIPWQQESHGDLLGAKDTVPLIAHWFSDK